MVLGAGAVTVVLGAVGSRPEASSRARHSHRSQQRHAPSTSTPMAAPYASPTDAQIIVDGVRTVGTLLYGAWDSFSGSLRIGRMSLWNWRRVQRLCVGIRLLRR